VKNRTERTDKFVTNLAPVSKGQFIFEFISWLERKEFYRFYFRGQILDQERSNHCFDLLKILFYFCLIKAELNNMCPRSKCLSTKACISEENFQTLSKLIEETTTLIS